MEDVESYNSKQIICHLMRKFYTNGWCSGSGGGISVRESDDTIYVAPSGVQKEYLQEKQIYRMNIDGQVVESPDDALKLKPSECTPLFLAAFKLRNAGACLHSHSLNSLLITRLFDSEVQLADFEMIKGIRGHTNTEFCRVPIIENTERECELTERLKAAIIEYPRAYGVLVRNHGIYVWGEDWRKAKIYAECYDYMFRAVIELSQLHIAPKRTLQANGLLKAWYIDEDKTKNPDIEVDLRDDLQQPQVQWVHPDYLKQIGVEFWRCESVAEVDVVATQRSYKNRDEVRIGLTISPNYGELLAKFRTEHLHYDEEVRFIMDGSGYFDVRDHTDRWIRIHVKKGDLLVLPEGIYHRFITDRNDYVHAMRLFKDEPKWTPYNRPDDSSVSRQRYQADFLKKNF